MALPGIDDAFAAITRGNWLRFLPERLREPAARALIQLAVAAVVRLAVAPLAPYVLRGVLVLSG